MTVMGVLIAWSAPAKVRSPMSEVRGTSVLAPGLPGLRTSDLGPLFHHPTEHQVMLPRRRHVVLAHHAGDLSPVPDLMEREVERQLPFRHADRTARGLEG